MFEYPIEVLKKKIADIEKAKETKKVYSGAKNEEELRKTSVEFLDLEMKLMDLNYAVQLLEDLGREPTDDELVEGVGYDVSS